MLRPKSIATMIVIGLVLTLAPLIAAVITAVVQVDRLAMLGRDTVLETAEVTRESRGLFDALSEMRRPFLQYRVTRDKDYYDIYLERRAELLGSVDRLDARPLTALGRAHLEDVVRLERQLFESVRDLPAGASVMTNVEAESRWANLQAAGRAILSESGDVIDDQVNELTRRADTLQRALLTQAAAVIPGTLCLAAVFFGLITRPMKELGRAIRRLGGREPLYKRISVSGPRDVQELGEQLEWLRQRIQQLEQQKIAFLRHISHELKTPLTTIRAGSELLVEGLNSKAGEEAEISRIIHANGLQLQRLIEDLLRFSETQKITSESVRSDPLDLAVLVRGVVAAQMLAAEAKCIDVGVDLTPTLIRGDEDKVRVVVDNLLTNAIKFAPRGGTIRVSLRPAGSCAVLDVEDSGPGIAEDEVEKIFEPFQRGGAESSSSVKGTGLGLSIAKEYVEAHDGHIGVVESAGGAHFRVSIPITGPSRQRTVSRSDLERGVLVSM